MKLKMRHTMRRSQEEIENSFNPVNLDYIFQEEDPLSPWLEEREGPLLDGIQNSEWLPIDSDDDNDEGNVGGDDPDSIPAPSQGSDGGGLSPPSHNNSSGGSGGDNIEQSQERGGSGGSFHSFQEEAYVRRDQNLMPHRMDEDSIGDVVGGGSSRGRLRHGKSRRHQETTLDDSSSSSVAQSFGNFGIAAPFEGNQGYYPPYYQPPYYQHPSYMSHGYDQYKPNPPYFQPPINYQDSDPSTSFSYEQQQMEQPRSSGVFDYVFGGTRYNDDQGDSGSYDPARRSTIW